MSVPCAPNLLFMFIWFLFGFVLLDVGHRLIIWLFVSNLPASLCAFSVCLPFVQRETVWIKMSRFLLPWGWAVHTLVILTGLPHHHQVEIHRPTSTFTRYPHSLVSRVIHSIMCARVSTLQHTYTLEIHWTLMQIEWLQLWKLKTWAAINWEQ